MTPAPFHDASVPIVDGTLFVRRWDPPGARAMPPLVLLHDSLGSVGLWRDFPAQLATSLARPVLAYDRAGFGHSSPRSDAASPGFIDDEATRVFPALRDALGLDAFALFGHSVGGAMAIAIAATQGEACRFVVAESAQAFVEPRTLAGIRAAKARFQDPAAFERLSKWHGERARWVLSAWTDVWLDERFRDWSLDAWLPRVRCPVLAIHGDRDEYGSVAFPRRIADGVAGPARCEVMEDTGHVPHRERPEAVLQRVTGFVEAIGAPASSRRDAAGEATPSCGAHQSAYASMDAASIAPASAW